jgi:hypothetical protein
VLVFLSQVPLATGLGLLELRLQHITGPDNDRGPKNSANGAALRKKSYFRPAILMKRSTIIIRATRPSSLGGPKRICRTKAVASSSGPVRAPVA